ncbi:MAG: hypothetical protein NW224_03685 [Leptolyngbyaceae cyanobacterium bins.302]|nr:hypothetical protein [Leptolyngbyaceae cyanobacterium bins.302]
MPPFHADREMSGVPTMMRSRVMDDVYTNQGKFDMQLVEIIREVLETGMISMSVERKMYQLLDSRSFAQDFSEMERRCVDQLLEAMQMGRIQPIA